MSSPPAPSPPAPSPEALTARIERLRAEQEVAESDLLRALFQHEIGVLEELAGDASSAAREQLDAVNIEPEFHEPLERLIQLIRKTGSKKNVGKLLERLAQVSEGADERVRALLDQAAHLADVDQDLESARVVLEEAAEEKPNEPAVFLALELVAAQLADPELRQRALAARADLCAHPTWKALLLLDLAELERGQGDEDSALGRIEQALETKGAATYAALQALETLGRTTGRDDVTARALESQAALFVRSQADAKLGDGLGVPTYCRTNAHAADAWLRAAEAHRRRGDLGSAARLLDQALSRVSDEPALTHARMIVAELSGDTQKGAELAKSEIERGAKGPVAAALWLLVAESAAATGDGAGAIDAVRHALAEDPGSIPARVLELDLLGAGQDAPALASSLEACAESMKTDEARARYFLLAAETWARIGSDVSGAKAALSQAGMYGAEPLTIARTARMLAALVNDLAWYEEGCRRLAAARASEAEQVGAWFEIARLRLLRGDVDHVGAALDPLSELDAGRFLGATLRAFVAPAAPGGKATDSEAALATLVTSSDEATSRALRVTIALRALEAGRRDDCERLLSDLHREDASDALVASALASLLRSTGKPKDAAATLVAAAAALDDAELQAWLEIEAGMLSWQAGERAAAVETFSRAAERAPAAGSSILGWALRAADPEDLDARRRALQAASSTEDDGHLALEGYCLEAGTGGDPSTAAEMLDVVGASVDLDMRNASLLARSLSGDGDSRAAALEAMIAFGGSTESAARSAEHLRALESVSTEPEQALESAARWADADPSLPPALEWLSAAMGSHQLEAELEARRTLAERMEGPAASPLRAAAALTAHLSGAEGEPLLTDETPVAKLTNLELCAPGSDPRRRATALAGVAELLGEESTALARALAGWSHLVAGEFESATQAFRAVVEAHPEELIGWEGLRTSGKMTGDRPLVAEACAALGDAVSDDARGAELWEESAFILVDELGDTARGEFALSRAIERDIGRAKAFDKLFRIVRARKDGARLQDLITSRLDVAEDPDEIAKLYWERARVLREAGDREGALAALENVTLLEPDHVGALALSGEIYLTTGKLPEAAQNLARLASLDEAPAKQRLMSGVAAVDIYENKLGLLDRALDVLDGLYRSGLSTLPVRERFARAAAKAQAWKQATEVLEQLMQERESSEGRVEAARLAMAIYRDRMQEPGSAAAVVERLLGEAPDDGEALDLVLSGVLPRDVAARLLAAGQDALVRALVRDPMDPERVDRLARIAAKLDNAPLRQAALGALVALGEASPEIDRELAVLDQRVARVPQIAIDPAALPDLCDPDDLGAVPTLMSNLASTFSEALGPGLAAFGVGKRERVDPRAGLPVRNEIAAWVGALGIGDFELYVGGQDDDGVFGVASEVPALVIGRGVQAPLSAAHRQAVARELFALRRGVTILRYRDAGDIAALVVASCRLAGYDIPSPQYAMLAEFQRLLGKEMPRKVKKILPELAAAVANSGQDPVTWVRAGTASLDRLAAIAAGDVSWVLSGGPTLRGQPGASLEAQERASRLLSFVLSPTYLMLREQLGMGVR